MKKNSLTFCAYDRVNTCGGPYGWAADFAAFLKEQGIEVRVLIICSGGQSNSPLFAHCLRLNILARVLDRAVGLSLEEEAEWILQCWRKHPTPIFIANLVLPALYAARWIRKAGGRTVGVIHSNPEHDPFYADMIKTFIAGSSEWHLDSVVPVSDFIAEKVEKVAPSGMRLQTIPCGTKLATRNTSWTSGPLRLLYCGRLVQKQKRIRELTEAFLKICELPGVTASICGDGEERGWLETRLVGQAEVTYLGNVPPSRIHEVMANHHVIVLLSDFEGLPMALVEGMSCGLVPVCFDEPSGAREIVRDGVNGFLVADREQSFYAAIERLLDKSLWSRFSQAARTTVEGRYGHPVVFKKWLGLISELCGGVEIATDRIPSRISLRAIRGEGSFVDYPRCRPSRLEQLLRQFGVHWMRFRLFVRPRARWRELKARGTSRKGAV